MGGDEGVGAAVTALSCTAGLTVGATVVVVRTGFGFLTGFFVGRVIVIVIGVLFSTVTASADCCLWFKTCISVVAPRSLCSEDMLDASDSFSVSFESSVVTCVIAVVSSTD